MRPPWASTTAFARYKPETGALGLADSLVGAVEAVKDVRDVGGVDPGTLVADGDDNLLGADLPADADLAAGGILDGVRDEVGDDLGDAVLVGKDDGELFGEVDQDGVTVGLGAEALGKTFSQGRQGNVGEDGGEPARLEPGSIQEVLDHGGEMVSFLFDDGETVLDDRLIPPGILAAQGGDIALDERHGGLELVADDGDEGVLDLFSVAELGDVADGGDDIAQRAVGGEQGSIGDADRKGWGFGALEVAFNVEVGVGGERPAGGFGFLEGLTIGAARPADDVRMGVTLDLGTGASVKFFEGDVAAFDGMVGVEDEDAIGGRINQGVKAALLVTDLGIKLGVKDGDGSLVGEGLEQELVVGGKEVGVAAEDKKDADDLRVGGKGDADAVQ